MKEKEFEASRGTCASHRLIQGVHCQDRIRCYGERTGGVFGGAEQGMARQGEGEVSRAGSSFRCRVAGGVAVRRLGRR